MGNNACGSCEFVIQKLHIRVNHTEKLCGSCEYVLEIKQEIKLPIEGDHGQKLKENMGKNVCGSCKFVCQKLMK